MAARKPSSKPNGQSKRSGSAPEPAPRVRSSSKSPSSRPSNGAAASSGKGSAGSKNAAGRSSGSVRRTPIPNVRQSTRRTPIPVKKGWQLRLYVAGDSPRSRLALSNLRRLCEEKLQGNYEIEVIDLVKLPHLAKADQILAVPTLVRSIPEPMKRIIGDLSDADRALIALELDVSTEGPS